MKTDKTDCHKSSKIKEEHDDYIDYFLKFNTDNEKEMIDYLLDMEKEGQPASDYIISLIKKDMKIKKRQS